MNKKEDLDIKKVAPTDDLQNTKSISQITQKDNYIIIKAKDLKKKKIKKSWLIKNWFLNKGIGLLHSQPGMSKTWWALDFCINIASGHKFANQWKTKQGKCLYIAAEDFDGVQNRLKGIHENLVRDIKKEFTENEIKNIKKNIDILAFQEPINLVEKEDTNSLINKIKSFETPYKFMVIDTLQDTYIGSINDDTIAKKYMLNIRKLSEELNCFILVVCHEGKSEELKGQAMGTIRFKAMCDTDLTIEYYCSLGDNKKEQRENEEELKRKIQNHEKIDIYKLSCIKIKGSSTPESVVKYLYSQKSIRYKDDDGEFTEIAYLTKPLNLNYTYSQKKAKDREQYKDSDGLDNITAEDIAEQFDGEVLPSEPPF